MTDDIDNKLSDTQPETNRRPQIQIVPENLQSVANRHACEQFPTMDLRRGMGVVHG